MKEIRVSKEQAKKITRIYADWTAQVADDLFKIGYYRPSSESESLLIQKWLESQGVMYTGIQNEIKHQYSGKKTNNTVVNSVYGSAKNTLEGKAPSEIAQEIKEAVQAEIRRLEDVPADARVSASVTKYSKQKDMIAVKISSSKWADYYHQKRGQAAVEALIAPLKAKYRHLVDIYVNAL